MSSPKPWKSKTKLATLMLLAQLVLLACSANSAQSTSQIRMDGLKQSAMSYSAQKAVVWRYQVILAILQKNSIYLNQIYRFQDLLLKNNLLPPVLTMSANTANLGADNSLRLVGEEIKILKPAKLITAPPTWLDYVYLYKPERWESSSFIFPRTHEERKTWDDNVTIGWEKGLEQAESIFSINFSRLNQDFLGMLLYHHLLAENMISPTYTAKADIGITGNEHHIRINDKVVRITSHSELLPKNSSKWSPVIVPAD